MVISYPLSILFGLLACAGIAFGVLGLVALLSFKRQPQPEGGSTPPVSILKPLKGCDPEMYEAFRSHGRIEYPEFEILFGVSSPGDEAVPFVQKLIEEFPQRRIRLVVCEKGACANRKAANLAQMAREAAHDLLVVNDSDITVPPEYLRELARWSSDPKTGLVTCLYRGRAGKSLWSKLESLGIGADFIPGALTSRLLEGGVHFGLGSTLAVRREALEKAGGFEAVADHLADDYELAANLVRAGYEVRVPPMVVETTIPDYGLRGFWEHQLRWGRTVRSSRPGGYFGMALTFSLFWALLAIIASVGEFWAWGLFYAVVVLRITAIHAYGELLGDRGLFQQAGLFLLRDLIAPVVWLFSLVGNRIVWRGEVFELDKGRLKRL